MEFEIPSTVPILLLSSLPFLYMLLRLFRNLSVHPNQIPGPKKLPIIGNLHLLIGDSRPPHQTFRDLAAKHGPLMHLQLGEVPFVIVSSVEVAQQVLKTHDITFANRPPGHVARPISFNYTNIVFAPYGEYWRHLRKICTLELLSARRVRTFRNLREDENLNLAKWLASTKGKPANLTEKAYLSSFDIATRASIGSKTDQRAAITSAIKQALKLGAGFSIADLYPSVKSLPLITGLKFKISRIFRNVDTILGSIIKEHRVANASRTDDAHVERTEDLIDVLLKYQEDGVELPLTTENIKAVLMDMFTAGGDTSATVVDWAMSEMVKNPTTLKLAQEEVRELFDGKGFVDETDFNELKYLKLVIKETLRMHTPVPLLIPRYNTEKCEINGYEIPAKTTVMINAWALARDPKYWNEPDKFIPERFLNSTIDFKGNNLEYIPFGAGRRMCPGSIFGLTNVEFTLCMLLYHFDWAMPNGMKNEDLDMTEGAGGITLKRLHDLQLIPTVKRPLKHLK